MDQLKANEKAPAYALHEAEIKAPIHLVWSLLTDLENWPAWNEGVEEMHLEGEVAVGTKFRWKGGGMKIHSRIEELTAPVRIVWSGRTMGIRAIHSWTFAEGNNGTTVRTEESFEGLVVSLLAGSMRKALAKALQQGLAALKTEAEKRAHAYPNHS